MQQLTTEELADIERRFEQFDPDTATHYKAGDALPPEIELVQAQATHDLYELRAAQVMAEAVNNARTQGYSWHKIGLVLGTTGEAARQRYRQPANA